MGFAREGSHRAADGKRQEQGRRRGAGQAAEQRLVFRLEPERRARVLAAAADGGPLPALGFATAASDVNNAVSGRWDGAAAAAFPQGLRGGVPLVLFDAAGVRASVLAPASSVLATTVNLTGGAGAHGRHHSLQ